MGDPFQCALWARARAAPGWLALAALLGCGHAPPSRPAASTTPPPAHNAAPGAPARGGSEPHPSAASQPLPSPPPVGSEDITEFMAEHFAVATWARDAVINGNLDALRRPLRALASYPYASVAPGGWLSAIAKLQQAARLTADAKTLDLAATGVATMGRICGECHREHGQGPVFVGSSPRSGAATSDTFGARMARHMWAADRMWEGLTGPSDQSWRDGAKALAQAPEAPPRTDPPLPPRFSEALLQVRALGQRAGEAESLEDRANVYAVFLASCAGCHAYQAQYSF